MRKLRSLLTYSNVMATIAVFIALGGTSYAVATNSIGSRQIKNNSIRSGDIRDNSLIGTDVRDNSLTGKDIAESSLGKVGSAANADKATNATSAGNAGSLGGTPAAGYQRFGSTLPSGQSESGDYGIRAANSGTTGFLDTTITFATPLASAIPAAKVVFTTASSATHCPGVGQAEAGYLCIYENSSAAVMNPPDIQSFEGPTVQLGAGRFGFDMEWSVSGTSAYSIGSWTVTAA